MDMSPAVEKLCESKVSTFRLTSSPVAGSALTSLLLQINNFILHMNPLNKATYQKLRTAPGITNTTERLERDLQQAKAIVQAMEKEQEDTRGSEAIEKKIEEIRSAAAAAPKSVPAESDAEMKVDEETKLSTANEDVLVSPSRRSRNSEVILSISSYRKSPSTFTWSTCDRYSTRAIIAFAPATFKKNCSVVASSTSGGPLAMIVWARMIAGSTPGSMVRLSR